MPEMHMVAYNRSRKRHVQEEVHADHGLWRQMWSGNQIVGYEGRFPKDDYSEAALLQALDYAEGVAWYLAVSNTTPKPRRGLEPREATEQKEMIAALQRKDHRRGDKIPLGLYIRPTDEKDAYVIRIDRNNARLDKFEEWAAEHNFLPDLRHAKEERNERQASLKAWRNVRSAGAINNSLEWKSIGSPRAPGLEAVTKDPHMAYALAIYLHNEGYLDGRAFGKLYWQTNQAVREEKNMEFHIAIQSDQVDQFREQFPNACSKKTLPGMTWAEKTSNGSKGNGKPKKANWKNDHVTGSLFGDDDRSR
jgi:hypothetical protein